MKRLSQSWAAAAQDLRSSLPPTCPWLDPVDVNIIGSRPIDAGRFADIWVGACGDRKVVVKSYRCYVSYDHDQVVAVCFHHSTY